MEVIRAVVRTGTRTMQRIIVVWWPTLLAMWSAFWFFFVFTPLEFSDAVVKEVGNRGYMYINISRKPFPSSDICQFKQSTVVVTPNVGQIRYEVDNSAGTGTGSSEWSTWRHTGEIPLHATSIAVYKVITYECLKIFTKVVRTPVRLLEVE